MADALSKEWKTIDERNVFCFIFYFYYVLTYYELADVLYTQVNMISTNIVAAICVIGNESRHLRIAVYLPFAHKLDAHIHRHVVVWLRVHTHTHTHNTQHTTHNTQQ